MSEHRSSWRLLSFENAPKNNRPLLCDKGKLVLGTPLWTQVTTEDPFFFPPALKYKKRTPKKKTTQINNIKEITERLETL